MGKLLRVTSKAALILLGVAAAGLVVYAYIGDRQRRAPAPPSQPIRAPGTEPATAGVPSAPETAPASADAEPGPTAPLTAPPPQQVPPDLKSEMVRFTTVLRDREKDRDQATVTGERALWNEKTKIYDLFAPLVTVYLVAPENGGSVDQLEEVEVTAERAEVDKEKNLITFFDDVLAKGQDFAIRTPRVTYQATAQTLTSDDEVRIQKDKTDESGARVPVMVITGSGLQVDLMAKTMTVNTDVKAHIHDVSEDFLASGTEEASDSDRADDVVITSDGKLLYEHIARRAMFFDNVVAVAGDKTIYCDRLTILLGETAGKDKTEVTDISAAGNVRLVCKDQVSYGDKLEWRSVDQMGVLSGEPAVVKMAQFEITGRELRSYRMDSRFQVEGPGSLHSQPQDTGQAAGDASPPDSIRRTGPLRLTKDDPFRVTWSSSMNYDAQGRVIVFKGEVVAQQGDSFLRSDQLDIELAEATGQIAKLRAQGKVGMRDQLTDTNREAFCDTLIWNAGQDTVAFAAAEGETVNVIVDELSIFSSHVVFNSADATLECPAAGQLTVNPSDEQEANAGLGPTDVPIEVEWHRMMHFKRGASPLAMFMGSVTARRGDQSIQGETLRVAFDENMKPLEIAATGDAVLDVRPTPEEAAAEQAPKTDEAAGEEAPAPGLLPLEGEHWRLATDSFTIALPEELLTSDTPGSLTVLEADTPAAAITWQKSVRLDLQKNFAKFSGQVRADVPQALLDCQQLTLWFDSQRNLHHMNAKGDVHFARKEGGAWVLKADSAEAVFGTGNELRQLIARENVELRDATHILNAKRVQLFMERIEGKTRSGISRLIAERDVRVKYPQEREEGGGDRLEWNADSDTYVLTGDPYAYVRKSQVETRHDEIRLDRLTGTMSLPPGARPVEIILIRQLP